MLELDEPRVLVCGSRSWPWPATVEHTLDALHGLYGDHLLVVEGCATGADAAAHAWCTAHHLPVERHRCYPVNWKEEKKTRPKTWKLAGHERNQRMLTRERPTLVVAFHDHFSPMTGGTSDMCLRALAAEVPVWLVRGRNPRIGMWVKPSFFPPSRRRQITSH